MVSPSNSSEPELTKKKGRPKKSTVEKTLVDTIDRHISRALRPSDSNEKEIVIFSQQSEIANIHEQLMKPVSAELAKEEEGYSEVDAEAEDLMKQRGVTVSKDGKLMIPSQKLSLSEELCKIELDDSVSTFKGVKRFKVNKTSFDLGKETSVRMSDLRESVFEKG